MENAGVQKQQTAGTSSTARPMWDPFWFMRAMLSWGRPADAPSFDVKETDDTYVCRVNAKLMLPQQADAAHVKVELKDGELTLLVPKAAATASESEPESESESESDAEPEQDSISASPKARRPRGNGRRGSAKRRPGRRARK